ncbi:hypothetical protein ACRAWD_30415 [Caulobacter segnis]
MLTGIIGAHDMIRADGPPVVTKTLTATWRWLPPRPSAAAA